MYVARKRWLHRKFARFVLFRRIKKRSFNLCCNFCSHVSTRWQKYTCPPGSRNYLPNTTLQLQSRVHQVAEIHVSTWWQKSYAAHNIAITVACPPGDGIHLLHTEEIYHIMLLSETNWKTIPSTATKPLTTSTTTATTTTVSIIVMAIICGVYPVTLSIKVFYNTEHAIV